MLRPSASSADRWKETAPLNVFFVLFCFFAWPRCCSRCQAEMLGPGGFPLLSRHGSAARTGDPLLTPPAFPRPRADRARVAGPAAKNPAVGEKMRFCGIVTRCSYCPDLFCWRCGSLGAWGGPERETSLKLVSEAFMAKVDARGSWLYRADPCDLRLLSMLELNKANIKTWFKWRKLKNPCVSRLCKMAS